MLAKACLSVHDTAMFFPFRPIALRIVVNAALIWLGLRFAIAFTPWGLNATIPFAAYMILLTTGLTVFDARRRSRYVLIENLGISTIPVSTLAACPPLLFETIWLIVVKQ